MTEVLKLTSQEQAEVNKMRKELAQYKKLKDNSDIDNDNAASAVVQRKIKALEDRIDMYTNPKRLASHRFAEAKRAQAKRDKEKKEAEQALQKQRQREQEQRAYFQEASEGKHGSFMQFTAQKNPSVLTMGLKPEYVPMYESAAPNTDQTPAQTAAKKSGNSSTHAGSRNNGTRSASTASRRRTATTRSQSSTRTLRQTTPLDNADLDRVVRMTPTYLRNFLVQAKIITEDESNNNRSSNKLRELLRDKLSSLTDEQKKLLDAYVTEQNTAIKEHWNEIRTSGSNADSEFDMTKAIMQRDKDAAQKQAEVQPQKARKSIGERLWDSLSEESKEKIKVAIQTPPQPKQPAYPHLPQNLINAIQNNPEEMYKYFRRHSKSCGDFKKADVLGKDGKPDAAKMLGWLNEQYPDFKEGRKQKIDKACLKYDQSQNNQPQSKANSHQQETTPPAKSDQKINISAMIQEAGRLR